MSGVLSGDEARCHPGCLEMNHIPQSSTPTSNCHNVSVPSRVPTAVVLLTSPRASLADHIRRRCESVTAAPSTRVCIGQT